MTGPGTGGATAGFEFGDMDRYTARGDYSAWVLEARTAINHWLAAHPAWSP